jgi:hypothetical protein
LQTRAMQFCFGTHRKEEKGIGQESSAATLD